MIILDVSPVNKFRIWLNNGPTVAYPGIKSLAWCQVFCAWKITTVWQNLDIKTMAWSQIFGTLKTVQQSASSLTSKPWLQARCSVHGRWNKCWQYPDINTYAWSHVFGGCTTLYRNCCCRKRSYDPIIALTQTSIFRDYDYFEYISE